MIGVNMFLRDTLQVIKILTACLHISNIDNIWISSTQIAGNKSALSSEASLQLAT